MKKVLIIHNVYHRPGCVAHVAHWLSHTIMSSLIHGLIIYGAAFYLLLGMSLGEILLIAALGLGMVAGTWWLCSRSRGMLKR